MAGFITLVGPPNSGKTTLFNLLSGKNHKTINYPGSTIEYNSSGFQEKYNIKANLLDSPGIISLLANSPDEEVTIDSLYEHPEFGTPNLIIVTVDASQLSRHLLLAEQLIDSKFNIIVVVTMIDILEKKGYKVCAKDLERKLNCHVVKIDGRNGKGIGKLISKISLNLENQKLTERIKPVKIDEKICESNLLKHFKKIEQIEREVIKEIVPAENIIEANKSLNVLNQPLRHKPDSLTIKLDRIFLHRFWGLFIFFISMGVVFTSIFWLALPLMELVDESFASLAGMATEYFGYNW